MASVYASDENQTDVDLSFDKENSDCCSFIIQEEDGAVFAFRRDSTYNYTGVSIHTDTIGDMEIIKQEVVDYEKYFVHSIITENGWIASQGGSQYDNGSRAFERLSAEMILSNNISSDCLKQMQEVLREYYQYGHYFIKSPDGEYAVIHYNSWITGKLEPGQFLTIPNIKMFFRQGNYTDYGTDPVDAIIEICAYEDSGWNRRNLYTYDYKAHDTPNGQKYGVDIYVTNDNGHYVGLNTSGLANYFYFNGELYPKSSAPENPDKLYLATYIFENQTIDSVFEVVSSQNNVLVNSTSPIHYRINNIEDKRTVVFDLDENIEFVDAEISQGNYSYDSTEHNLYWNLPESANSKDIVLNIRPKTKGYYNIHSYVEDINEAVDVSAYATDYGIVLTSDNVTTFKTYHESLDVYLTDDEGVFLVGENVSIVIDGITYIREVTPKGYASLAITFQPGEYDAVISYDGDFGKNQTSSRIIVKKTLFSDNLECFYGEVSEYSVKCLDEYGNALTDYEVDFRVDGVLKDLFVNEEGICSYNITDLKPGNHSITSFNLNTNEFVTNWIYVKEPVCDLVIEKSVGDSSICIGDDVKWTITVLNNGSCDAPDAVATDLLPQGLRYVSYDASKGLYDAKSGKWTIGDLANGESATLHLYCIALIEGIITNEANVICNETDSDTSNNYHKSTVNVTKNETPNPPSPENPVGPDESAEPTESVKMFAAGNPIACIIVATMLLLGSFWNRKNKK